MLDKYLALTPYSLAVSERRAKMLEDLNVLVRRRMIRNRRRDFGLEGSGSVD